MVDVNKLKGKIVEKGLSVEKVAERIEIDKSTLYRKLNINGETITIKEASKLVELLGLSPLEASAIFFAKKIA